MARRQGPLAISMHLILDTRARPLERTRVLGRFVRCSIRRARIGQDTCQLGERARLARLDRNLAAPSGYEHRSIELLRSWRTKRLDHLSRGVLPPGTRVTPRPTLQFSVSGCQGGWIYDPPG